MRVVTITWGKVIMFTTLWSKNFQRRKFLKKTTSSVMKDYFSNTFPDKNEIITNVDIVALDFETTGLDKDKDCVISAGLVDIVNFGINLKSATHQLISCDTQLPEESVVIHQITDNELVNGDNVETVLPYLLSRLSGKVLLAHHASVELFFMNKMCQEVYASDFLIPVIDTQYLAKRSFDRKNINYKGNDLRLFNLRKSFNMPAYKAHNALMDAVATAELFLVMANTISPKSNAKLREFLS